MNRSRNSIIKEFYWILLLICLPGASLGTITQTQIPVKMEMSKQLKQKLAIKVKFESACTDQQVCNAGLGKMKRYTGKQAGVLALMVGMTVREQ